MVTLPLPLPMPPLLLLVLVLLLLLPPLLLLLLLVLVLVLSFSFLSIAGVRHVPRMSTVVVGVPLTTHAGCQAIVVLARYSIVE